MSNPDRSRISPYDSDDQAHDAAEKVTRQGIWWNLLLTAVKGGAAYVSGSKAMLADAIESASDIAVTVAVLISLKISRRPQDADHPYGHGKIESLSAQIIGIVLLAAAAGILWMAVVSILNPPEQPPASIAFWVALTTIVVKELLFRYTLRIGKRTNSPAVTANAWGHRSDAYSSVVTMAGIGGAILGYPILDPIAAAIVSLFIIRMGVNIIRESAYQLMDGVPDREILAQVIRSAEIITGVEHVHQIRGRRVGRKIYIDLTLEMDPDMTLNHSHSVAHDVKESIRRDTPEVADIMVHINPHVHPHTHQHEL